MEVLETKRRCRGLTCQMHVRAAVLFLRMFFFVPRPFPPARWYVQSVPRPPTLCRRLWPLHERAGRRLAGTRTVWRASASTSARGGSVTSHSSAISSGSSKRDHAKARCAATANMPAQRWLVACRAAARRRGGAARAFEAAMRRRKSANSAPKRLPTSSANTTSLQRRAAKSSG